MQGIVGNDARRLGGNARSFVRMAQCGNASSRLALRVMQRHDWLYGPVSNSLRDGFRYNNCSFHIDRFNAIEYSLDCEVPKDGVQHGSNTANGSSKMPDHDLGDAIPYTPMPGRMCDWALPCLFNYLAATPATGQTAPAAAFCTLGCVWMVFLWSPTLALTTGHSASSDLPDKDG